MKGILLAGGRATRLYPATHVISKQLIPIFDKPMIYYPLSTLLSAGIRDILIISNTQSLPLFQQLFGDGSQLGINIEYTEQAQPLGIAHAFILAEDFIQQQPSCLILGDNIFYGTDLQSQLKDCASLTEGAKIFGYYVRDPERYGVAEINKNNQVISIEEKPSKPKSNYAVTGLYFYDHHVVEIAKTLQPSARGELEVTDINKYYLEQNQLNMNILERGCAWLDTGTHESFLEACNYIAAIEHRQGLKIGCIEEIAYQQGFIDETQLQRLAHTMGSSGYGDYLMQLLEPGVHHV